MSAISSTPQSSARRTSLSSNSAPLARSSSSNSSNHSSPPLQSGPLKGRSPLVGSGRPTPPAGAKSRNRANGTPNGAAVKRRQDSAELPPDEELRRLGRDELVRLLRTENDAYVKAQERVDQFETREIEWKDDISILTQQLGNVSSRGEQAERDAERLENDLSSAMLTLNNVRARAQELEKEKRDIQRRYDDQEKTFETERKAMDDNEKHLKSRIITITRKQSSSPIPSSFSVSVNKRSSSPVPSFAFSTTEDEDDSTPDAPDPGAAPKTPKSPLQLLNSSKVVDTEKENLKRDLSTLESSYASLHTALNKSREECIELKKLNSSLMEEVESYGLLLVEKTLNGGIRNGELLGRDFVSEPLEGTGGGESLSGYWGSEKRSLHSLMEEQSNLGEENSEFGDESETELDPELIGNEASSAMETHEVDPAFAPSSPSDTPNKSKKNRKKMKHEKTETLGDLPVSGSGMDLAAELGRAEHDVPENGMRSIGKGEEGEALRAEVKQLKEANKALSIYCSKIIDRIIAKAGFEDILCVDDGKGIEQSIRRSSTATKKQSSPEKQTIQQLSSSILGASPSPTLPPAVGDGVVQPRPRPLGARHGRSQSAMPASTPSPSSANSGWVFGRSVSGTSPQPPALSPPAEPVAVLPSPPKGTTKKARPGSWMTGLFSSSSTEVSTPPNAKPGLKSLSLLTDSPQFEKKDRRLKPDEEVEDEEDRLQRQSIDIVQRHLALSTIERGGGLNSNEPIPPPATSAFLNSLPSPTPLQVGPATARPHPFHSNSNSSIGVRSSSSASTSSAGYNYPLNSPPLPSQRPTPIDSLHSRISSDDMGKGDSSYFPSITSPSSQLIDLLPGAVVTEEMVALRISQLEERERQIRQNYANKGSSGGLSSPSSLESTGGISKKRVSIRRTNAFEDHSDWLKGDEAAGGGNAGRRAQDSNTSGVSETLFDAGDLYGENEVRDCSVIES